MSTAVSNPHPFSAPFPAKRALPSSKQQFFRSQLHANKRTSHGIKALGGDGKEHTQDQLQIPGKHRHHQSQTHKRRFSQSAPVDLWDRFPTARTVRQMMETMDRIMEDPFAYSGISFPSLGGDEETGGGSYRRGRTPWEIKEGDGEYKMRFDMPGMKKEDIKVWVEEKILVVKAEKQLKKNKESREEENGDWSAKSYGRYNSRIVLPENVEVEKIKAEVKDGVLYITIPKASEASKVLDIDVQ